MCNKSYEDNVVRPLDTNSYVFLYYVLECLVSVGSSSLNPYPNSVGATCSKPTKPADLQFFRFTYTNANRIEGILDDQRMELIELKPDE